MEILDRFLQYVKINTQSDASCNDFPSTKNQKVLLGLLEKQLLEMGLEATYKDGYTYALLKKNSLESFVSIGYIAHVDTSPDASGENIKPRLIKNYKGDVIKLNESISMSKEQYEDLSRVIGEDIVVTDGNTLLGADDKAGVTVIMEFIKYLVDHPSVPHGDIYICFTPDEEIGRGTDKIDLKLFKPLFAYTLDGSEFGGIEYETFNAASASIKINGKGIHPGSAKNKMVNASRIAIEFDNMLDKEKRPEYTSGYDGFNHLVGMKTGVESGEIGYIIRNHDKKLFEEQKQSFFNIMNFINNKYKYKVLEVNIMDSYYNMAELLQSHVEILDLARTAIRNTGIEPFSLPIRGGTDGARLTFMGLLTPNLGVGAYNFHGPYEFVSITQMEKATKMLIEMTKLSRNFVTSLTKGLE